MDSVQVGKAVFVKESYTTLGIEPRTYSYPGRSVNHTSVCWVKKRATNPLQLLALETILMNQFVHRKSFKKKTFLTPPVYYNRFRKHYKATICPTQKKNIF